MADTDLAVWRTLYERAIRIKELAPWTWMHEDELFGVEDPETKSVAYVSISGTLGEHLAVIAYLGDSALHRFLGLQAGDGDASAQEILEMRQIQASFENRSYLGKDDLATIRSLGLKFRGSHAWPRFRSTLPGCVPWFLDTDEMRIMAHILEQTEGMVLRVKDEPSLLGEPEDCRLLVRKLEKAEGLSLWVDEWRPLSPPPPVRISVCLDRGILGSLLKQPETKDTIEADLVMLTSATIHQKPQRPYFGYALLLVDGGSGVVLSVDMLSPLPTLEDMWGEVVPTMIARLDGLGFIPGVIKVRGELMEFLGGVLAEHVPAKVRRMKRLPNLEPVVAQLQMYMGNR